MIRNQWYVILESNEVRRGKPVGFTRMGEKMVAWRDSHGQLTVMSDLCPHRGVALSAGKVIGDCVQCPFHGFEYDISGQCTLIPANGRRAAVPKAFQVKTYPTREAHGFVYIWWGEPQAAYPELPWFEALEDPAFSYSTLRDAWATHYSRAIENQLDVVHLPFVHYNTIGRGNRTLVNGPVWQVEEKPGGSDLINVWVYNVVDRGQAAVGPKEMPAPNRRPFIQFRFPNIWHNWISDDLRVMVAFAPIDDENTLMYLRWYQRSLRIPILREVVNWLGRWGNLVIERQDRRVVITQRPKPSGLKIGEKLIPGDGPIIEYRRRRAALQEAARG